MAPKLSPTQLDSKLDSLRDDVRAHLTGLAARGKRSPKAVLAKQKNAAEMHFYGPLRHDEKHFTEAQQCRGE